MCSEQLWPEFLRRRALSLNMPMTHPFPKPLVVVMQHWRENQIWPSHCSVWTLGGYGCECGHSSRWSHRASGVQRGRGGGRGLRMDLVDAGIGAAGTTVPSLATLNHTGHLQTCHHWETAIPHLQGQHNDSRVKWKAKQRSYETDTWKQTWIPHHESWNYRLWELWFEGMHQLLSFGIVERE